jgi:hypothetical protein
MSIMRRAGVSVTEFFVFVEFIVFIELLPAYKKGFEGRRFEGVEGG